MSTCISGCAPQVLGRNLEGAITRAQDIQKDWKDEFTSVEHLVLALQDDPRFGRDLFKKEGLDARKLSEAIKQIRGSNRVTDQVFFPYLPPISAFPACLLCVSGSSRL